MVTKSPKNDAHLYFGTFLFLRKQLFNRRIAIICKLFISVIVCAPKISIAQVESELPPTHSFQVSDQIELEGLVIDSMSIENPRGRTRISFILNKLLLEEGMSFHASQFARGLDRLRATRLFKDVTGEAFLRQVDGKNKVHIEIKLNEKWTTLPDFRFGGGGGTTFFRLGVYDINWFGLGVQGLISYENRVGANNGDAWFRWPNAFNTDNLFGTGIRRSAVLLTDYDKNRNIVGGKLMSKTTLLFDFERPLTDHIVFGYRMEPEWVSFNQFQLAKNVLAANAKYENPLPEGSRRVLHRTQLRFSYLDFIGILADGFEFTSEWIPAFSGFGSERDIMITRHELKYFKIFNWQTNLGLNTVFGTSSDARPENAHRLGGLHEVRGYYDGEFQGTTMLLTNLELRKNLFETWSFVWQPTFFYDVGKIAMSAKSLWQSKMRDSIGVGLRVIPDFVHLAALRIDYAWPLIDKRNTGGLSFGLMQFF